MGNVHIRSRLAEVHGPRDLDTLTVPELAVLAEEIRAALVENVSRTGGHLGPNLGVVELTLALHTVFESPRDALVFDTGHQGYVHKLLTGRADFARLRREGGLSGYLDRAESEHDIVQSSHASSSIGWAYGIATGRRLRGESGATVAIVGDGALTGGVALEALNDLGGDPDADVVVVLNDNTRSYAPTVGGIAAHLAALRAGEVPVGTDLFTRLGLAYSGPLDGHDLDALRLALGAARDATGPRLVHVVTRKGNGFPFAEADEADRFHSIGVIDPLTGLAPTAASAPEAVKPPSWTDVFGDHLLHVADRRDDVVALTAAMTLPVGLGPLARRHPHRVLDVGIAEQQALTTAAGLAYAGLHPVVSLYSTFLTRAVDQLLMDVGLHRAGVTITLDRAGITGDDGPSHHGMWDLALASVVPGISIAAPRDADRLRRALDDALSLRDAPSIVRYPKGTANAPIPAVSSRDGADVLAEPDGGAVDVVLVTIGALAPAVMDAAAILGSSGLRVRVVDPVWALPVRDELCGSWRCARTVVTIEDGVADGGVGTRLISRARDLGFTGRSRSLGVPSTFIPHASRADILRRGGLDADGIAGSVRELAG